MSPSVGKYILVTVWVTRDSAIDSIIKIFYSLIHLRTCSHFFCLFPADVISSQTNACLVDQVIICVTSYLLEFDAILISAS